MPAKQDSYRREAHGVSRMARRRSTKTATIVSDPEPDLDDRAAN